MGIGGIFSNFYLVIPSTLSRVWNPASNWSVVTGAGELSDHGSPLVPENPATLIEVPNAGGTVKLADWLQPKNKWIKVIKTNWEDFPSRNFLRGGKFLFAHVLGCYDKDSIYYTRDGCCGCAGTESSRWFQFQLELQKQFLDLFSCSFWDVWIWQVVQIWYMGVSKNRGTPKWMDFNEKPY